MHIPKEQETIFIRTCVHGKTITRLVCIGEPQSTSSEDMFAFVNEKLNENYLTNPVIGKDFYKMDPWPLKNRQVSEKLWPWLYLNENKMFCKVCMKAGKKNTTFKTEKCM
jgi:hypothetical protein